MGFPQVWIRDACDEMKSSMSKTGIKCSWEEACLASWGPGFDAQNPTKTPSVQYPGLTVTNTSHLG